MTLLQRLCWLFGYLALMLGWDSVAFVKFIRERKGIKKYLPYDAWLTIFSGLGTAMRVLERRGTYRSRATWYVHRYRRIVMRSVCWIRRHHAIVACYGTDMTACRLCDWDDL